MHKMLPVDRRIDVHCEGSVNQCIMNWIGKYAPNIISKQVLCLFIPCNLGEGRVL